MCNNWFILIGNKLGLPLFALTRLQRIVHFSKLLYLFGHSEFVFGFPCAFVVLELRDSA